MAEAEKGEVVEVKHLAAWTTGYSEEHGSIALVLCNTEGQEFGVVMPPAEALAIGAQLSELGLRFTPTVASA